MKILILLILAVVGAVTAAAAVPASLPAEDIAQIRTLQAKFISICQRSAWNELPPFFTTDAILVHAHEPAVQGIEAIQNHYRSLKLRVVEAKAQPAVIDGSGKFAYLRGTYDGTFQVGMTKPAQDAGMFLWVLRKQADDSWKIAEDFSVTLSPIQPSP